MLSKNSRHLGKYIKVKLRSKVRSLQRSQNLTHRRQTLQSYSLQNQGSLREIVICGSPMLILEMLGNVIKSRQPLQSIHLSIYLANRHVFHAHDGPGTGLILDVRQTHELSQWFLHNTSNPLIIVLQTQRSPDTALNSLSTFIHISSIATWKYINVSPPQSYYSIIAKVLMNLNLEIQSIFLKQYPS